MIHDKRSLSIIYWLTIYRLKDRYRKTIAGFVWVILNPIIMYGVQALVFKNILQINVPNYHIFLLSGLLPWIFISQSLEMGIPVLESNGQLLRSLSLSPSILVISQIFDNFINFMFSSMLILLFNFVFHQIDITYFFLLPISIGLLLITIIKLVEILSILQVFYLDIKFIVSFLLNIMIFLTPIFYPIERIPEHWQFLVNFNPFYLMIQHIRTIIYNFHMQSYIFQLVYNVLFLIGLLLIDKLWIADKKREIPFVI